jgi:hypothetical protein
LLGYPAVLADAARPGGTFHDGCAHELLRICAYIQNLNGSKPVSLRQVNLCRVKYE